LILDLLRQCFNVALGDLISSPPPTLNASEEVVLYEVIYRQWCASNGKEYEAPLEYYRIQLDNKNSDPSREYLQNSKVNNMNIWNFSFPDKLFNENRKKVYNHIRQHLVVPTIFTNYVYNKLNEDYDSVWHLKTHFVTQLSVCSLVGYL